MCTIYIYVSMDVFLNMPPESRISPASRVGDFPPKNAGTAVVDSGAKTQHLQWMVSELFELTLWLFKGLQTRTCPRSRGIGMDGWMDGWVDGWM